MLKCTVQWHSGHLLLSGSKALSSPQKEAGTQYAVTLSSPVPWKPLLSCLRLPTSVLRASHGSGTIQHVTWSLACFAEYNTFGVHPRCSLDQYFLPSCGRFCSFLPLVRHDPFRAPTASRGFCSHMALASSELDLQNMTFYGFSPCVPLATAPCSSTFLAVPNLVSGERTRGAQLLSSAKCHAWWPVCTVGVSADALPADGGGWCSWEQGQGGLS